MPQTCVIGHHSRVLPYLSAPYGNSHRCKLIYPKVWQRGTSVVCGFGEAHLHAFLPDGRDSDVLQWFKLCGSHLWSTRCTWSDHVQRMISVCGAVLRFAWAWVAYVEHGAVCARWWHVQVCTADLFLVSFLIHSMEEKGQLCAPYLVRSPSHMTQHYYPIISCIHLTQVSVRGLTVVWCKHTPVHRVTPFVNSAPLMAARDAWWMNIHDSCVIWLLLFLFTTVCCYRCNYAFCAALPPGVAYRARLTLLHFA